MEDGLMGKHDGASPVHSPYKELPDLQDLPAKSTLVLTLEVNTLLLTFKTDDDHPVTNSDW